MILLSKQKLIYFYARKMLQSVPARNSDRAGLDPEERVRLRNLVASLAEQKTIILSTHIVSDIEDICSKIGILNKGNMIFQGDKDELIRSCDGHLSKPSLEEAYIYQNLLLEED